MKDSTVLDPPVHLYVKTHKVTGLKYFGRTIKDPFKYAGSGLHWLRHLKKHGRDLTTEVIGTYTDSDKLHADAFQFSVDNSIVESHLWANLITETGYAGIDGWVPDEKFKKKLSENSKKMWSDPETKERLKNSQSKAWTPERKAKHAAIMREKWKEPGRIEARKEWLKTRPDITEAISKSRLGSHDSDETKEKKSAGLKAYKRTEEHAKNLKDARWPILR